ncbi:MAG: hypothetical protein WCZ87_12975 [Thiohalobacteraceae bacterium]
MNDPWSAVQDGTQLHGDFLHGQRAFERGDLAAALAGFKSAHQLTAAHEPHAALYMSFLGLVQVLMRDVSGLNLCRRAAHEETHRGDVFENLVRAELELGHRRQAWDALRRGLKLDKQHAGLRALRVEMGARRHPALSFLDRDNLLNRMIGRFTYRPRAKRGR